MCPACLAAAAATVAACATSTGALALVLLELGRKPSRAPRLLSGGSDNGTTENRVAR